MLVHKRVCCYHLLSNVEFYSNCVQQMQMTYLEEWPLTDRDYSSSLSGATEALRASTLRLPVVGGAKVSINISASQKLAHLCQNKF